MEFPSSVTPNILIMGTGPTLLPGIPGKGLPTYKFICVNITTVLSLINKYLDNKIITYIMINFYLLKC